MKNGAITGDPLTVGYASHAYNASYLDSQPLNSFVLTSGDQSIQGIKIFTDTIVGSISGNAGTSTKLATARTFTITDNDATNSQAAATGFDGLSAYTIKLPATIKATVTGTASGNIVKTAGRTAGYIPTWGNADGGSLGNGYNVSGTGDVVLNTSPAIKLAASTSTAATQIPVFIADPSTNAQTLVTRTPAQIRADIGAGTGNGTVTAVSGTANQITSSGGTAPTIGLASTITGITSLTSGTLVATTGITTGSSGQT